MTLEGNKKRTGKEEERRKFRWKMRMKGGEMRRREYIRRWLMSKIYCSTNLLKAKVFPNNSDSSIL